MSERPVLVLVGGFLGAGKTTLLLRAARWLKERGLKAAIVTNDQAGALVDTRHATAAGVDAAEVAGACFCCHFGEFISAVQSLLDAKPDVIFAEPVGSCMDLSATVLQPLKQFHGDAFRVAPYSVLIDPARAGDLSGPDADIELAYLFRNQMAEADLLLYTKSDLYPDFELPAAARRVSAASGQGVAEWLGEILNAKIAAGGRLLDIDYARYAAAEAALGWMNWEAEIRLSEPLTPAGVVGPFLESLDARLTRAGAAIAHLKIFDSASSGYVRAGICRNGDRPSVEGDPLAEAALDHELILNLRARTEPAVLREVLAQTTAELPGRITVLRNDCFQPSPPVPEHRFKELAAES